MNRLSRRKFLAAASLATIAVTASGISKSVPAKKNLMHVVYYWLKNTDNDADKQKLIDGLHQLVMVKQIKYHHIGIPQTFIADDPLKGYHVSLLMIFDEPGDIDVYHKDPIHQKFVAECGNLWVKTVKYDSLGV